MKLTLIGGGGVRAPLFVASALRRAQHLGIEELCLMDVDAEKLVSAPNRWGIDLT